MANTTRRLYSSVTPQEIATMADTWNEQERFERHVNRWLTDHNFDWDPSQTNDQNRTDFFDLVDRVMDHRQ